VLTSYQLRLPAHKFVLFSLLMQGYAQGKWLKPGHGGAEGVGGGESFGQEGDLLTSDQG